MFILLHYYIILLHYFYYHYIPYLYKKTIFIQKILKKFLRFNINMINLSLDELRLIAQNRNIRDYENKSEKDLIKALSEPKPKNKN